MGVDQPAVHTNHLHPGCELLAGGGPTVFNADVAFAEDTNTIVYATLDRHGNFNPLLQVLPTV